MKKVISYAISIFFKKKSVNVKPVISFEQFDYERENLGLLHKQEFEDRAYLMDVKRTALNNFIEWQSTPDFILMGKNYGKLCMLIAIPSKACYTIYNEKTAKYKNADFHKLVRERFNELKIQFENSYEKSN
ncbi:MAG TPA: hypothetical protein PK431_14235 [Chitinophagales bacterium]|nr:hypothetical protein [Chitinophagales bacterium]